MVDKLRKLKEKYGVSGTAPKLPKDAKGCTSYLTFDLFNNISITVSNHEATIRFPLDKFRKITDEEEHFIYECFEYFKATETRDKIIKEIMEASDE